MSPHSRQGAGVAYLKTRASVGDLLPRRCYEALGGINAENCHGLGCVQDRPAEHPGTAANIEPPPVDRRRQPVEKFARHESAPATNVSLVRPGAVPVHGHPCSGVWIAHRASPFEGFAGPPPERPWFPGSSRLGTVPPKLEFDMATICALTALRRLRDTVRIADCAMSLGKPDERAPARERSRVPLASGQTCYGR